MTRKVNTIVIECDECTDSYNLSFIHSRPAGQVVRSPYDQTTTIMRKRGWDTYLPNKDICPACVAKRVQGSAPEATGSPISIVRCAISKMRSAPWELVRNNGTLLLNWSVNRNGAYIIQRKSGECPVFDCRLHRTEIPSPYNVEPYKNDSRFNTHVLKEHKIIRVPDQLAELRGFLTCIELWLAEGEIADEDCDSDACKACK